MTINGVGIHYRDLNEQVIGLVDKGQKAFTLEGIRGQRYIGVGLGAGVRLDVRGVPGNDLGAFMNGAEVHVHGNAQDGVGNTMNAGKIVIHGDAGDVLGHSIRGGKIFVRGSVSYRVGIHMKAYRERFPVVVIGETVGDYAGEYMAGGILAVLNLSNQSESPVGRHVGTGMHGGTIYVRGEIKPEQLGREVQVSQPDESDWAFLKPLLEEFKRDFQLDGADLRRTDFHKLAPQSSRPYGRLYAY